MPGILSTLVSTTLAGAVAPSDCVKKVYLKWYSGMALIEEFFVLCLTRATFPKCDLPLISIFLDTEKVA